MNLEQNTNELWQELRDLRHEYLKEDSTMTIKQYIRREIYIKEKYGVNYDN